MKISQEANFEKLTSFNFNNSFIQLQELCKKMIKNFTFEKFH